VSCSDPAELRVDLADGQAAAYVLPGVAVSRCVTIPRQAAVRTPDIPAESGPGMTSCGDFAKALMRDVG
jgi:hypothetical protein